MSKTALLWNGYTLTYEKKMFAEAFDILKDQDDAMDCIHDKWGWICGFFG